jgi:hypothetical protein
MQICLKQAEVGTWPTDIGQSISACFTVYLAVIDQQMKK